MPSSSKEGSQDAARVLADDHSEIDILIGDLLAALDEGEKSKTFARLDLLWARLAVHIRAEHLCLFPSILEANFSDTCNSLTFQEAQREIDKLRLDHDFFMRELGTTVNTLRKQQTRSNHGVISKQLRDVRRSVLKVQSRLDTHNQLEENHVYKWVNVVLDEAKRLTLMARIRHEMENMPPRFKV
jgi:hypothetical protein